MGSVGRESRGTEEAAIAGPLPARRKIKVITTSIARLDLLMGSSDDVEHAFRSALSDDPDERIIREFISLILGLRGLRSSRSPDETILNIVVNDLIDDSQRDSVAFSSSFPTDGEAAGRAAGISSEAPNRLHGLRALAPSAPGRARILRLWDALPSVMGVLAAGSFGVSPPASRLSGSVPIISLLFPAAPDAARGGAATRESGDLGATARALRRRQLASAGRLLSGAAVAGRVVDAQPRNWSVRAEEGGEMADIAEGAAIGRRHWGSRAALQWQLLRYPRMLRALVLGRDRDYLAAAEDFRRDAGIADALRLERLAESRSRRKTTDFLIIIEKKFGEARAAQIKRDLGIGISPAAILDRLRAAGGSARDATIVETEYDNVIKQQLAAAGNDCPHLRLLAQMRRSSTRRAADLLQQLRGYFAAARPGAGAGPGPGDSKKRWLMCKRCGFRAICPHVVRLVELQAANAPYSDIRNELQGYVLRDRNTRRQDFTNFCVICTEQISVDYGEDRQAAETGLVGEFSQDLSKLVWRYAMTVVKLITFPHPVDPKEFASAVTSVCFPLLVTKGDQLAIRHGGIGASLAPSSPEAQLSAGLLVYAFVYGTVYGAAVRGVVKSYGFAQVRKGSRIDDFAKAIFDHLLKTLSLPVSQLENVSAQKIKDMFKRAIALVLAQVSGKITVQFADDVKMLTNEIFLMPQYQYAARSYCVFENKPFVPRTAPQMMTQFERALGKTVKELRKSKNFLETLYEPTERARARHPLYGDSYAHYLRVSRAGLAGAASNAELAAARAGLDRAYAQRVRPTTRGPLFVGARGPPEAAFPRAPLSRLFDENGNPHRWSIFVYSDGTEGSAGEAPPPGAARLADRRCAECAVLRSQTLGLDGPAVARAVDSRRKFANFLNFYTVRCPEGGLHDYRDGAAPRDSCAKCGISVADRSAKTMKSYYERHRKKYDVDSKEINDVDERLLRTLSTARAAPPPDAEWTENFAAIGQAADLAKIPARSIEVLGATYYGQNYEDLLEAEIRTAWAKSDWFIFLNTDALIRLFYVLFNLVRYYSVVPRDLREEYQLDQLMEGLGGEEIDQLPDLVRPLPNITRRARRMAVADHARARRFLIQSLCEIVVSPERVVAAGSGGLAPLIGGVFVRLLKRLIDTNRSFSKPGAFNFAVLYGERGELNRSAEDLAPGEDVTSAVGEMEGPAEAVADDGPDEEPDPYSYEEVDFEEEGAISDNDAGSVNGD